MYKDDLKLVKRLLKGDQKAFDAFYATYFPRVFRFCRIRVDSEEHCKDIVQQTMINAVRGLETYRGEASLHTWLCRIGRNELARWYQRHGARQARTLSLDSEPDLLAAIESIPSGLSGAQFDDLFDLKELVVTSLDQLPPNYSEVLQMKYIQGLSVEEMALQLATTGIAVQSLLARARSAFKTVFNDLYRQSLAS